MKTIRLLSLFALGFATLAPWAGALEKPADKTPRPVRLQLRVDLPFSMNPIRDDDIAEAFAHRVVTALHEQGFKGRIKYVENGDRVDETVPVLDVRIFEWRVNRIGHTDCVFSAALKSPRGEQNLGMFSGTSIMTWMRRDWFARADSFDDAARDALGNLKARLDATDLIEPAVTMKK
ncbi:MAG: hypothetical protein Q8N18_10215 [Opitutaceae bacterium]|nr:hypothetical protein [Opitutaceae bacterium]